MKKEKKENATVSTVCRIDKKNNFTVMSNQHLCSPNLSLKAIGLLSKVFSLPEGWNFSVAGLASICKEGKQAIKTALAELEEWGYLELTKLTPDKTSSGRIEYIYTFYEHSDKDVRSKNITDSNACSGSDIELSNSSDTYQDSVKQDTEKQAFEFQTTEIQFTDNPTQSNTKDKIKNNKILYDEISIHQSMSSNNSVEKSSVSSMDDYSTELEDYTGIIKNNLEYYEFVDWLENEEEAEEIIQMIARQICSRKPTEYICGQEFPREVVKSAMLKIDTDTLEDAINEVSHVKNVRNYEKYLISTLFNAVNSRRFKEDSEAQSADYAFKKYLAN